MKFLKTTASWILALILSIVFVRFTMIAVIGKFEIEMFEVLIIPIGVSAALFYVLIRKTILK